MKKKDEENQKIRAKFNGELVMEWSGLKGKELGNVITEYRKEKNEQFTSNLERPETPKYKNPEFIQEVTEQDWGWDQLNNVEIAEVDKFYDEVTKLFLFKILADDLS